MASYKDQNTALDEAIARVSLERDSKLADLKQQFDITLHSLKPIHILNNTLEDFKQFPETKWNIIQALTSLVGGYVSKKIIVGKPKSTFTKILGYLLQYGVTNFISNKVKSTPK